MKCERSTVQYRDQENLWIDIRGRNTQNRDSGHFHNLPQKCAVWERRQTVGYNANTITQWSDELLVVNYYIARVDEFGDEFDRTEATAFNCVPVSVSDSPICPEVLSGGDREANIVQRYRNTHPLYGLRTSILYLWPFLSRTEKLKICNRITTSK